MTREERRGKKGLIAVIKGLRDLGKLVSDGRLEFCGCLVVCQCLDAQEAGSVVESGQLWPYKSTNLLLARRLDTAERHTLRSTLAQSSVLGIGPGSVGSWDCARLFWNVLGVVLGY